MTRAVPRLVCSFLTSLALGGAVTLADAGQSPSPDKTGVVLIAHGANREWNARVHAVVERVRLTMPTEPAFLMGIDDQTPQQAYDKLAAAGVEQIAVVPLFVSSFSAHAEQVKFIGGLRDDYPHAEHMKLEQIKGPVAVAGVASAMDDHAIVASILADRAQALSRDPASEVLVIVAHGPNEDDDAERWNATIERLAEQIRRDVPFSAIDVRLLRDDAPKPVKDKALAELRESVASHATRERVIVIPLLVAPGRVANQIPEVLEGLAFEWDGQTLLPDDRMADWVVAQAQGVLSTSSPSALQHNEQVVVTATRTERPLKDVPVYTEVIDAETIHSVAARSIADVLPHQAGVEIVPGFAGDTVQIQGIDGRGVLVLVDGQEVIGRISSEVDVGNLLVDDIERIEVVKGAASAVYGSDALAGVVNIITRQATRPVQLSVDQRFESLSASTTMVSAGGERGPWNAMLSASHVTRDAYDLVPDEPSTTGSELRKVGVNGSVGYQFDERTNLRVTSRYYDESAADIIATSTALRDDEVLDSRWQNIAELRTGVSDGMLTLRGHVSTYRHLLESVTRGTGVVSPDLTREALGEVEAQYDRPVGGHHFVSVGGEFDQANMRSDRISGGERDVRTAVGFVQDEWFVHDRVRLLGGVRYDHNDQFGDAWSPKLAVLVHGTDNVRLRASYGEGFKAPELKDLYFAFSNRASGYEVIGNPDLRPEESRSVNAGVEVDFWQRRARVNVTLFQHRIEDLIDTVFASQDPTTGLLTFQTANVGQVRSRGAEARIDVTPRSWLTASLSYARLDAKDLETDEPLTSRAKDSVKGRVSLRSMPTGTTFALFGRYLGRRPFADLDDDGRIEDYAPGLPLWDVRVAQDLGQRVALLVGAENIFDEQDVQYFPSQGRRVYVGATLRYDR
ncbi:MAG: TonB-dependent receptor [Luteitalea sp.]|nr:TonB-dependent receptor [Luteitalea sp.]